MPHLITQMYGASGTSLESTTNETAATYVLAKREPYGAILRCALA